MLLFHSKLLKITIILFIMFFQHSLSAQDNINWGDVVSIPDNSWKMSKKGEIEHYKNFTPEIIPEYFVLGTLRSFDIRDTTNRIDSYQDDYEEPAVNFLDVYIKEKFGFTLQKEMGYGSATYMYSPELAKRLRKYFDKEGNLDISLFKSDEEICSFLTGVYYRDGYKINDSIYKIQFVSSYHELVYILLKRIDCDKIFYMNKKYFTPGANIYYFEPSVPLKKYLDSIETEKTKLLNNYVKKSKYYNKDQDTQYKEKEKKMIETVFSFL